MSDIGSGFLKNETKLHRFVRQKKLITCLFSYY